MAKTLHFQHLHHLNKLHGELLTTPTLQPITNTHGKREAVLLLSGGDDDIWLTVPDDADESAIQAVVDAHDPTPPPPPEPPPHVKTLRALRAKVKGGTAPSQAERDAMILAVMELMADQGFI